VKARSPANLPKQERGKKMEKNEITIDGKEYVLKTSINNKLATKNKEGTYIIREMVKIWLNELKSLFFALSKLKDLVPLFFTLSILLLLFRNYEKALYAFLLYIFFYVWKIVEQGDWRHKMREDIIKKHEPEENPKEEKEEMS
jgi:hypothetical protein